MEFRLTIRTDNVDGIDDYNAQRDELIRLLDDTAQNIASGCVLDKAQTLRDVNGNRVGQYKIHEKG